MQKKTLIQTLKFTLFSISAGIIQIGADAICNELILLPAHISHLIALVLSVVFNFTVNKKFTFKSATNVPIAMLKVALFYLVFTPLSTWWTKELVAISVNEYIVLAGTMLINFVTEFLYCKFVVYRNSEDTLPSKTDRENDKEENNTEEK